VMIVWDVGCLRGGGGEDADGVYFIEGKR